MATFAWIILSPAQALAAVALNDGDAALAPPVIDNPLANNLGDPVVSVGVSLVPARLLNDPAYARWYSTLGSLPIRMLDSDILFLPPPEDP